MCTVTCTYRYIDRHQSISKTPFLYRVLSSYRACKLISQPSLLKTDYHCSKRRFNYCSGMVRPTDQKMPAIEKIVCHLQFPRGRGTLHHATGSQGEAPGSESLGRESKGTMWAKAFIVVSVGKARQEKQALDWLV